MRYVAEIGADDETEGQEALQNNEEVVDLDDLAFMIDDYGGKNVELVREQGKVFFDGDARLAARVEGAFVGTAINVQEVFAAEDTTKLSVDELERRFRTRTH